MSHLPFTLVAYFFNSLAVLIDKFLLDKDIPNPLLYVFNISMFSLLILVLIPFVKIPIFPAFVLASASTILWTSGLYFMYRALKIGVPARVIPVIGTLIPLTLTFVSAYTGGISANQLWAVSILIAGFIFLVLPYFRGKLIWQELQLELVSALFFADSYIILRMAYLQENFFSVFVYSRVILIPLILMVFVIPKLRKIVWSSGQENEGKKFSFKSRAGMLFFIGQFFGGISELLLTFSISLANPALVNSLQGTQYVFLFIFSYILAKYFPKIYGGKVSKLIIFGRILGIMLIAFGLYLLSSGEANMAQKIGITYSTKYAAGLGLDPRGAFLQIVDDLNVKYIRFPIYWDDVEKKRSKFDFSQADYYLNIARAKKINVILVLGYKQPRWPECFSPEWTKNLTRSQKDEAILNLVKEEVSHFKKFDSIKYWQVENEPLFSFGVCERVDEKTRERLQREVAIVKGLDQRQVMVTDSGELSSWLKTRQISDILGVTLYRTVWNPVFGLNDYPLPPSFYSIKAKIVKFITGKNHSPVIISELQAEPWIPAKKNIIDVPIVDKIKYFPVKKLSQNVEFAKQTGFEEIYLWGAEWWFWMGLNAHPEYMETAKNSILKSL